MSDLYRSIRSRATMPDVIETERTQLLRENAELKRRLERTEAMLARHFMGGGICCQQDGEAA